MMHRTTAALLSLTLLLLSACGQKGPLYLPDDQAAQPAAKAAAKEQDKAKPAATPAPVPPEIPGPEPLPPPIR